MIVVHPAGREYGIKVKITDDNGKVIDTVLFTFRQLTYHENSDVMSQSLVMRQGQGIIDAAKKSFVALKYGLVRIEGFGDDKGKPYELRKESNDKGGSVVTDECLEELLATTSITDRLLFSAAFIGQSIPKEITHPLTGEKIVGVEVMPPTKKQASKKK